MTPKNVVPANELVLPPGLDFSNYDWTLAGSPHGFEDYEVGENIDHLDGMTVEEAEHQLATRLYQNTAKVHFDALAQKEFALRQAAHLWRRRHLAGAGAFVQRARQRAADARHQWRAPRQPAVRGRYALCVVEVLAKDDLGEVGALRLRLVAVKNQNAAAFPFKNDAGEYDPNVVLDFDYWAAIPKR